MINFFTTVFLNPYIRYAHIRLIHHHEEHKRKIKQFPSSKLRANHIKKIWLRKLEIQIQPEI